MSHSTSPMSFYPEFCHSHAKVTNPTTFKSNTILTLQFPGFEADRAYLLDRQSLTLALAPESPAGLFRCSNDGARYDAVGRN